MSKVYTIIANFSVDNSNDYDEIWVANYKNRNDAICAFKFKLKETDALNEDGTVTVETNEIWSVEKLFEDLITNGTRFHQVVGSETNNWFIRGEELQDCLNEEKISWK